MKLEGNLSRNKSAAVFTVANPPTAIEARMNVTHTGVKKSLKFIGKNFSLPIQMKHLVKVSGMSRRGFQKAFKKNLGANPGSFLRSVRVEQAKRLLVEQDLALKQIAPLCGFRSENTFCVAFSREMKTSPKKFQRQYWLTVCRERCQIGAPLLPSDRLFRPAAAGNVSYQFNRSKKEELHVVRIF